MRSIWCSFLYMEHINVSFEEITEFFLDKRHFNIHLGPGSIMVSYLRSVLSLKFAAQMYGEFQTYDATYIQDSLSDPDCRDWQLLRQNTQQGSDYYQRVVIMRSWVVKQGWRRQSTMVWPLYVTTTWVASVIAHFTISTHHSLPASLLLLVIFKAYNWAHYCSQWPITDS